MKKRSKYQKKKAIKRSMEDQAGFDDKELESSVQETVKPKKG